MAQMVLEKQIEVLKVVKEYVEEHEGEFYELKDVAKHIYKKTGISHTNGTIKVYLGRAGRKYQRGRWIKA